MRSAKPLLRTRTLWELPSAYLTTTLRTPSGTSPARSERTAGLPCDKGARTPAIIGSPANREALLHPPPEVALSQCGPLAPRYTQTWPALISPQAWMPEALPLSISRLMREADCTPQPGGASTKRGGLRNAAYAYAADPGRAPASCRG